MNSRRSAGGVVDTVCVVVACFLLIVGGFGVILTVINPLNVLGITFYLLVGTVSLIRFSSTVQKHCVQMVPRDILVSVRQRLVRLWLFFSNSHVIFFIFMSHFVISAL